MRNFQLSKQALQEKVSKAIAIGSRNKAGDIVSKLQKLVSETENTTLRIAVLGETNHGKSTFCNALLKLAPDAQLYVDMLEATSVPTEIRYGRTASGKAFSLDSEAFTEFSLSELKHYTAGDEAGSRYARVEMAVPNPLLAMGAVIIDTPGVESLDKVKVTTTMNVVKSAHAVIFVTNRNSITSPQLEYLVNALDVDVERLFVLYNIPDGLERGEIDRSILALRKSVEERLLPLGRSRDSISRITSQIFPVCARQALLVTLHNDLQAYGKSGMQMFVDALFHFLDKEKTDVVLSRVRRKLLGHLRLLTERLQFMASSLNFDPFEIDGQLARLEREKDVLETLERNCLGKTDLEIEQFSEDILGEEGTLFGEMYPLAEREIRVMPIDSTLNPRLESLVQKLEQRAAQWLESVNRKVQTRLLPLVKEQLEQFSEDAKRIWAQIGNDFDVHNAAINMDAVQLNEVWRVIGEIVLFIILDLLLPGGPLWALLVRVLGKKMGDRIAARIGELIRSILGGHSDAEIRTKTIDLLRKALEEAALGLREQLSAGFEKTKVEVHNAVRAMNSERLTGIQGALNALRSEREKREFNIETKKANLLADIADLEGIESDATAPVTASLAA